LNVRTSHRKARNLEPVTVISDDEDDDTTTSGQAQKTPILPSRRALTLAQATVAMGTSIERAANTLAKGDIPILVREAVRDFQALYRESMPKAQRIRVIKQLGEGNNASFWLEMDKELKDDFAEELAQKDLL
jgi:hypothetical protein